MSEKADDAILVTGGAGYIGSHAVLALRDAGYTVCVLDDLSTGFRHAVPADVRLFIGDIGDQALVGEIIRGDRAVAIMHFAGSIRSDEHTSELQSLMRISYAVFCLQKKTSEHKTVHTISDNDRTHTHQTT